MPKIKFFIKTAILSILGACGISYFEALINEDTFHRNAQSATSLALIGIPVNTGNRICPTNFEAEFFRKIIQDNKKTSPSYSAWDKIKDTKYQLYGQEFVNVDNDNELHKKIEEIDKQIETCNYLIKLPAQQRIFSTMIFSALQPIHLIFGWVLAVVLLQIAKGFFIILTSIYFLSVPFFMRLGYFFRGIYRRIKKIFKDYEDLGK